MHWIELLVGTGFLGLILGPWVRRHGQMERWLRLAQTILSQILAGLPAAPKTLAGQNVLVDSVAERLVAQGVPRKYAAGIAADALRLDQRVPPLGA